MKVPGTGPDFKDVESADEFYARQASRTEPIRRHLYRKVGLRRRSAVLDAGCGTGVVTAQIAELTDGKVTGVDADEESLVLARRLHPGIEFIRADCSDLPYPDDEFDVVTTHFLFMWLSEPASSLEEMGRVLKTGGTVLACAEPDYGGRVEYPENLEFSSLLDESLRRQGADPRVGRRLGALFREAGLSVDTGVDATIWDGELLRDEFAAMHEVYLRDIEPVSGRDEAERVLAVEAEQVRRGKMLMIPIFWAVGRKPS